MRWEHGDIIIRMATIADAPGVSAVHCSVIDEWRCVDSGRRLPQEALTPEQRWLNGGPWMHPDSCADHIAQMRRDGHYPLVLTHRGEVVATADYWMSPERAPFSSLHLATLYVHADAQRSGFGRMLVEAGVALARELGADALTTQPEGDARGFYASLDFTPWQRLREVELPTRMASEIRAPESCVDEPPDHDYALRVGRYQCGAYAWGDFRHRFSLPRVRRLKRPLWQCESNEGMILGLRQQLLDTEQADGYIWARDDIPLCAAVDSLCAAAKAHGFRAVDLLLFEEDYRALQEHFFLRTQADYRLWRRDLRV